MESWKSAWVGRKRESGRESKENQIDSTHPPTRYRLEFLRSLPYNTGITLTRRESVLIGEELDRVKPIIRTKLIGAYRDFNFR